MYLKYDNDLPIESKYRLMRNCASVTLNPTSHSATCCNVSAMTTSSFKKGFVTSNEASASRKWRQRVVLNTLLGGRAYHDFRLQALSIGVWFNTRNFLLMFLSLKVDNQNEEHEVELSESYVERNARCCNVMKDEWYKFKWKIDRYIQFSNSIEWSEVSIYSF